MARDASAMERLAERIVDGEPIDWPAAEKSCATEEEREFLRNLRIVTDVARQSESDELGGHSATPTLAYPASGGGSGASGTPAARAEAQPDLAPGSLWGPLEIIGKIGQGGFGQVYRARDTRLDRIVALKLLSPADRSQEERALADGRLMARVRHVNVVTVHGAERIGDRVGIWMDHIDGETLEELLEHTGPLGVRDAAGIGIELCGALAAVHKAGLVHGDIKAQNVMKEKGGRLVLMDFGAAREAGSDRAITRISGTPLYMPPEVFEGDPMTFAGDVYALGVLLYRLVTRSFPVRAETIDGLRSAHARGEMTLLRDSRPDLSGSFVQVVEKALARDPAGRFTTMGRMQAALEQAILGERSGSEPASHAPPAPSRPRRAGWRMLVALAAGIFLVGAGVLWLWVASPLPVDQTTSRPDSVIPHGIYSISAALYRSAEAGRELLLPGARISVGDKLHMDVESSETVHVYVLSSDLRGHTFVLFPRPDCDLQNPLPPGPHRLPGRRTADGIPIDWQVDSAGGRERILILASRRPLAEVEEALARLPAGQQYAEVTREAAIRLRGIGGTAARPAADPPLEAAGIFEDVKRLAGTTERASGTWMRQIDLENPPAP